MTAYPYNCGDLHCGNKCGLSGPRKRNLCALCDSYAMTALAGWVRRQAHSDEPDTPWSIAYASVDALGALAENDHATYLFFRALHHVTCAQYNRTFGAVVKHMRGLLEIVPGMNRQTIFLGKEWETHRKCRLWCGRKQPSDCANSCAIAREYLLDVYRLGSQAGLDHAQKIIDTFGGMSGLSRCSAFNVVDDIFGLNPSACAALGQYTRKVVDGMEISLMARVEKMLQDRASWGHSVASPVGLTPGNQERLQ